MNDLLLTLADFQFPPVLLLLDLSVAFVTIGHSILQTNWQNQLVVSGLALVWLKSYLFERTLCAWALSVMCLSRLSSFQVSMELVLPRPYLFSSTSKLLDVHLDPCSLYMFTVYNFAHTVKCIMLIYSVNTSIACLYIQGSFICCSSQCLFH